MSLHDRVESLKAKHAALEMAIESEARRPVPDPTQIHDMKRKKLQIKDELIRIGTGPH